MADKIARESLFEFHEQKIILIYCLIPAKVLKLIQRDGQKLNKFNKKMPEKMLISESLPSHLKAIPAFIASLTKKMEPLGLGLKEEELHNIRLCLEEALTNAVRHGNKFNSDLSVKVKMFIDDARLAIEVIDQGKGFDFEDLPDPTHPVNLKNPSCRGVFLIKNLMDKVVFFDHGRGIRMEKALRNKPVRGKIYTKKEE